MKTPRPYKFSAKFFEFSLQNTVTIFNEKKEIPTINDKMKTGFDKFLTCLDLYLELLENPRIDDESRVNIYESVILENGAIMRAANNYHNRAWFSDVAVSMNSEESEDYMSDQGVCYGQVTEFIIIFILYLFNQSFSLFIQ
jgi:hypothetical protein